MALNRTHSTTMIIVGIIMIATGFLSIVGSIILGAGVVLHFAKR